MAADLPATIIRMDTQTAMLYVFLARKYEKTAVGIGPHALITCDAHATKNELVE